MVLNVLVLPFLIMLQHTRTQPDNDNSGNQSKPPEKTAMRQKRGKGGSAAGAPAFPALQGFCPSAGYPPDGLTVPAISCGQNREKPV